MEFPENFFQDEYRCDFLVPELMKRAWAAEMELLEIVINVCSKYHLQYFASYGTLLGAVRHRGFVPWDDDIDIVLKRKDYNTLLSVLPKELPAGFLIDGLHANNPDLRYNCNIGHTSLKTDSSYWSIPDYIKRFHGFPFPGTSIDIFPMDYIPRDPDTALLIKYLGLNIISLVHDFDKLSEEVREEKLSEIETAAAVSLPRDFTLKWSLLNLAETLSSMFSEEESDHMLYYLNFASSREDPHKKEWYDKVIPLPFEAIEINAPVGYHEILTTFYGDYQIPVKYTQVHDYPFYAKGEENLKQTLKEQGFQGTICDFIKNIDSFHILDSKTDKGDFSR